MNAPKTAPECADILIRRAHVVTLDPENRVISQGAIAISGNRIAWIGKDSDAAKIQAKEVIDANDQIAMPGLIDAHFHTGQQLLRGKLQAIARSRPLKLPVWKNYLIPWESCLDPEDVHLSGLVAYTNMIQVGTTCFAEAGGPHPDEMGRAALEVGIRGFISQSTVDQSENIGATVPPNMLLTHDEALEKNTSLVDRWKDGDRVKAWMSLRQVIVCSPELIRDITVEAQSRDVKIHTHLCEGSYEIDYTAEKFGMRPTEWLESMGVLSHRLHCAHSVLLSDRELDLYEQHSLSACHCGFGNYSIGHPRLIEMWRRGIDIGLGTDGPGGGGTIDLFQVAHVARVGQQAIHSSTLHWKDPISSEELLRVATHGGARALGIFDHVGSLEVGKKADILLADTSRMDHRPMQDPLFIAASVLVGRDMDTVLVDGRVVMRKREMVGIDVERINARLIERMPIISERFEKLVG
ncbi:amidohydrolase family protein [Plastorhodobacter daqingensis]|uniref:S-adenosylhomocysteine deaminase, methylthioadenosine deaminase n=2 Tax=Rhodobacterales TaxID=204455 RepID=A0A0B5E2K0_9RHOB|nr:amidohydrolase family protein [Celeribacter indicus]AJE46662.1 S-adenosylhomocysteine deaminase, methylthioadenosine deaminase [Celeribacter indicus]SDX56834.1 5-methylthioadenosine/S-adenosylhomocysteine deaminase [Celeribacter indicus]